MAVREPGLLGKLPGIRIVFTKGEKGLRVEPCSSAIVFVLSEQLLQGLDVIERQQMPGQHVADALIVIRIELEHRLVMVDGRLMPTKPPEYGGKTCPRPHVGAGFQKTPEVTGILLEPLGPEGHFPSRDALLVAVQHFLDRPRLPFGQKHISVGAQRRDFERFPGQRDTLAATGRFPGLIHDVLRGVGRVAPTLSAEKTCHEPLHAAPVRHWRQSIVIFRQLGFRHCLLSGLFDTGISTFPSMGHAACFCSKSIRRSRSRSKRP